MTLMYGDPDSRTIMSLGDAQLIDNLRAVVSRRSSMRTGNGLIAVHPGTVEACAADVMFVVCVTKIEDN